MRNEKKQLKMSGFTLVELMISIFLIVSIGAVVFSIFTSLLRGTKKATTINTIRENGNFAIAQMARNIQYSQITSICDSSDLDHVDLIAPGGESYSYTCDGSGNIASQSGGVTKYLIDTTFAQVTAGKCSFTCLDSGVTSPRQLQIKFQLENVSSSQFVEDQAVVPFNTSVTLRNFAQ